jgi:ankyrin repeat protein
VSVVSMLLGVGADPNVVQQRGFTPLMAAALHGDGELTDLLLACGADSRMASDDGRTAADMAHDAGHPNLGARIRGAA